MFLSRVLRRRHLPLPLARPMGSLRHASSRAQRLDRITARLPRRLQTYTHRLRDAPLSHIVSFLILHEITAVVPLVGLFGFFHYTEYVPVPYATEHFGVYVQSGLSKFERYFKRKQWFGFEPDGSGTGEAPGERRGSEAQTEEAVQRWRSGDARYTILVEVALAYAITKALLPVRVVGSVWATPWFAQMLTKFRQGLSRKS